jgi:hypothetical protein
MKKINSVLISIIIMMLLIPFSSCQKIIDRIFNHHPEPLYNCTITQVKQSIDGGVENIRTGIVYNNQHGDPDSVIFDIETGSAGAHLFYFKYDAAHRLVEYSGWYSRREGDYYFLHHYGYEGNKIIYDTTQWQQAGKWTRMGILEYDAQDRVIKENFRDTLLDDVPGTSSDFPPATYSYDANGNLTGATYDNKINFLRTNNVWMFTQRNYSKNNPEGATGYNDRDLPLGFTTGHGVSFLQFSGPDEITYDCGNTDSGQGHWDY